VSDTNTESSPSRIREVVDRYEQVRGERERRAEEFHSGRRRYLIFQTPPGGAVWRDARTSEDCFQRNLDYVAASLEVPSDHLPILEPWHGTGVFANIYGCPYVWRDGEAPAVHYRYHKLEEVRDVPRPRWEDSEIAQLVLETIRYFKSKTGDAVPIVWTDTQSASDNATLICDTCEVIAGCLLEPEMTMAFMRQINDVVIEFSRVQEELIGDALVRPGHIMLCNAGFGGMSISDDNLAVVSPAVNAEFNLPLNEEIGKAMGGVAIHSCGQFTHSMGLLRELCPSCIAIDCALDHHCDPNPNEPEAVRDAFAGSDIAVHVRMAPIDGHMQDIVRRLLHPELRLVVHVGANGREQGEKRYAELESILSDFYGS
jgi:uroporphyrinogen decarboxylase-like protein